MTPPTFTRRHPLLSYFALFGPHRRQVAFAILLALVKHSPVVFIPMYTAYVFDRVIPGRDLGALGWCAVGMGALIVMNLCLHPVFIRTFSAARREVALRLRSRLCERIQQIAFTYHDSANSGRLHSKVMQDVEKLDQLGKILIDPILIILATSVVCFFMLLAMQPAFLIVAGAFLPVVWIQRGLLSRKVETRTNELRVEQEKLNAEVGEMIGMLSLSRAHATEEEDLRRLGARMGQVRDAGVQTDFSQHLLGSQIWGATQILSISVVCLGAYLVIGGSLTIGEVVLAMSLVMMTVGGISGVLGNVEQIYAAAEAMRSIDEVMSYPGVEHNDGKPELPRLDGRIEFRDVWFAYPGTEQPVLKSVSLAVEPNQTIALVGASGAGKTTFMKLLLGFYTPIQGEVLVDGHAIETIDKRSLRRQLGIVTQDTFLFNGTILQNLAHGLGNVPAGRVEEAARHAHAHEFISRLERGYQTEIGDRGVRLSGGQKQRLAIARALLRNPQLLLLDEATSALDSESERAVQEALAHLMKDRTTFVIAHRLSTVRNADRILVFDDGRIVEEGRHDLLVKRGGVYARLVELQAVG